VANSLLLVRPTEYSTVICGDGSGRDYFARSTRRKDGSYAAALQEGCRFAGKKKAGTQSPELRSKERKKERKKEKKKERAAA
jgi:hypothetical protein